MSGFEIGYCKIEEYQANEPGRCQAASLSLGGLYTFMMSLEEGGPSGAAKYPSKITEVEELSSGIHQVHFSILNADLAPDLDTNGLLSDGYWSQGSGAGIVLREIAVTKAYFKQSTAGSGPEQELEDIIANLNSLSLPPQREVVMA